MKINWINTIFAICISALLAWWLWSIGIEDLQKWLLSIQGGLTIATGLIGGMGLSYTHNRSGVQVRIVMLGVSIISFVACIIYSFFRFGAVGFCIPMALFLFLGILLASKIYKTEM